MSVSKFMSNQIGLLKRNVINKISTDSFDSHEFIQHFAKSYESDYVGFLAQHNNQPFRAVNEQIVAFLSANQDALGIRKEGEVFSLNVFGEKTKNEKWIKL